MRFMRVNIADATYRLKIYDLLGAAIRINMKEMLSLIGMIAAQ